jgi:hypothetical protein
MMTFIRPICVSDVTFELKTEEEMEAPKKADFGDEAGRIWDRLHFEGNKWAWCTVVVRATWNGFVGEASLGECSYESEEDFLERAAPEYDAMMVEAFNDLVDALEGAAQKLEPLVTRESVDEWLVSRIHAE